MICITSERDVAEPRRLHTCFIKFNMWFCVSCALCVTVAVQVHPQNVENANNTLPREKRYGYYYHPPEYAFSTPPPSPYYSNQYPQPENESHLLPYGNLNLPPPPHGDLKPYTPETLPNSKEYPLPGDRSLLPSYGNLNPTLPHCDSSNPNILPTLPNNNEYSPPGDRIFLPPLGEPDLTLPNNGVPNDTSTFYSDRSSLPNHESSQFISSEDEEDPCFPHFSEKPDFLSEGRRISEAKCMDYVWNLKRMQEIEQERVRCERKRKPIGYFVSAPPAVGGRAALPGEFPHMGAVGWLGLKGEWLFKCGSSLISPKFVLTAAHCSKASSLSTDLADPVPKIVRLSHVNIYFARHYEVTHNYDVNIERIIVHPNYKPPKKYYDIALMELDQEVGFWQMVHPACLWTSPNVTQLSAIATLTGWGVLKEGSRDISPILQAAVVDFIGQQRCDALLAKKRNRNWSGLQEHQICAGKLAGGVDSCQGDSGGPLQVRKNLDINTPYKLYYVVGVTAFGFGCARRNLPGVYTRVSSFLDWIEPIVWP